MRMLNLHLTDRCNLRCSYCYQDSFHDQGGHMSFDVADRTVSLFDQYADRTKEVPLIRYTGGEILLNRSVFTGLVEKWGETFHHECITNGTLLLRELGMVDFIKENRIHVCISLDGGRDSHDRNRKSVGGKAVFDEVVAAVEAFMDYDKITVNMTVTPNTVDDFAKNVLFLIDKGLPRVHVGYDYNSENLEFAHKVLRNVVAFYQYLWKNYSTADREEILSRVFLLDPGLELCIDNAHASISVDPTGEVYMCRTAGQLIGAFRMGNVMDKGDEIFRDYDRLVDETYRGKYQSVLHLSLPVCRVLDAADPESRPSASKLKYWTFLLNAERIIEKRFGIYVSRYDRTGINRL